MTQDFNQWLSSTKTLIDSLDLVDRTAVPESFVSDILEPVVDGKACIDDMQHLVACQELLAQLADLVQGAKGKPWYFWESTANFLAEFCGAEHCAIHRLGDRALLFKIHPLETEEDASELHWPEAIEAQIGELPLVGFDQSLVMRLGPVTSHPLVFQLMSSGPLPRIERRRLEILQGFSYMLMTMIEPYIPHLGLTRTMEVAEEPTDTPAMEKPKLLGRDPKFLRALAAARQASASDAPVYFHGESGTGKELFARYLHMHSSRKDGLFVPINCSAIPQDLIESELFGHEKGAFTGAYYRKIGKAEQANGGTLFLDEIGEMPLPFQAKMLRFLQEKKFTRVGGNSQVASDARIVVATHRDLKDMVARGTFREDLYFRVHVIPIHIAPLRERGGDIRYLAEQFFTHYIHKSRMSRREVEETTLDLLECYNYPGNVRELQNIIQRTVVMTQKPVISPHHLPEEVLDAILKDKEDSYQLHPFEKYDNLVPKDRDDLRWLKKEIERISFSYQRDLDRRFLLHLLQANGGSARKAAESANINRTLFYKLLRRAGLDINILNIKKREED